MLDTAYKGRRAAEALETDDIELYRIALGKSDLSAKTAYLKGYPVYRKWNPG